MLNEVTPALIADLKAAVGENGWREGADMDRYLTEWRGLWRGRAAIVLRPADTAAAAAAMRLCHAARVAVIPYGGGTGLVCGQVAPDGPVPVVISTERMNRVRAVRPKENALIIEAGATLLAAQQAAQSADRLFPLSLGSEGTCTVGGVMATNAGGMQVLRYGNARDLCLGLEVVTPHGEIVNGLSTLRKDNTGYDLRRLYVGSEGTLCLITAAALRLFERPRARATAFIGLNDPADALRLMDRAQAASGGAVSVFELMPRLGLDFVIAHIPGSRDPLAGRHAWYVLLELWGAAEDSMQEALAATLEGAVAAGEIEDAAVAANDAQRAAFRGLREALSEAQKPAGGSIKHDICLPIGRVPEFLVKAAAAVAQIVPGARPCPFGHLGDGNLHYNISQPEGADKAAFLARWADVNRAVHDIVVAMEGSISAEHGVGRLKVESLAHYASPAKMAAMRAVKAALDPAGVMNPGAIFAANDIN